MSEERKLDPAHEPEEEQEEGVKLSDSDAMKVDMYFWLQALVMALVGLILVFTFVGRIIGVDGESMMPTLHNKDMLLLQSIGYEPDQGDVVVLSKNTFRDGAPIVKRIIAVGGQTVDIDYAAGTVSVDGEVLVEDYILEPMEQQFWQEIDTSPCRRGRSLSWETTATSPTTAATPPWARWTPAMCWARPAR